MIPRFSIEISSKLKSVKTFFFANIQLSVYILKNLFESWSIMFTYKGVCALYLAYMYKLTAGVKISDWKHIYLVKNCNS